MSVAAVLAYGNSYAWWLDLLTHFRVHYAILSVISFVLLLMAGRRLLCILPVIVFSISVMPLLQIVQTENASVDHQDLKILSWNVLYLNEQTEFGIDEIKKRDADILILSETAPHWQRALMALKDIYPYQQHSDTCDDVGCQVSLLSKKPWRMVQSQKFVANTPPVIWASFDGVNGSKPFHVFAVHARKAITADGSMRQRKQIEALGDVVRKISGPVILAGDMNATPSSRAFQRIVAETGLQGADISILPTWPHFLGPLGISIDHFFSTPDVQVDVKRLGYWNSDHRAIEGQVSFQP